jgi:hypothetical protein
MVCWTGVVTTLQSQLTSLGGVIVTQMGMGSAQAINAAWLTSKMAEHKRPVALACYVVSIQIASKLHHAHYSSGLADTTHRLSWLSAVSV